MQTTPSCLAVHHSNQTNLQTELNLELIKFSEWRKSNTLTINPSKSQLLVISPRMNELVTDFDILLNGITVPLFNSVKYLVATLDSKLTFESHIKILETNLSKAGPRLFGATISSRTFFLRLFRLRHFYAHVLFGADSQPFDSSVIYSFLLFFCRFAQLLSRSVELL